MLTFQIFDYEKVDQGNRVLLPQFGYSMAKMKKTIKVMLHILVLVLTIPMIITCEIFDLEQIGHGHEVQLLQ